MVPLSGTGKATSLSVPETSARPEATYESFELSVRVPAPNTAVLPGAPFAPVAPC
jgi:hypothetical protein